LDKVTPFKTNMREAFEAIQLPRKSTTITKKIDRALRGTAGVVFRKQLWYVKRHKKSRGAGK